MVILLILSGCSYNTSTDNVLDEFSTPPETQQSEILASPETEKLDDMNVEVLNTSTIVEVPTLNLFFRI